MRRDEGGDVADAPKKPRKPKKRKLPRGVIEHGRDAGVYCAQYFCRGCPQHPPGTPRPQRRHRESAGSVSLARDLHRKRKTEIREGRFFPKPVVAEKPWDPVFADYIDDYVSRVRSTLIDVDEAERHALYWKQAPEARVVQANGKVRGKTMREMTKADAERYRERRRTESAPGARRRRGGGSGSTVNKELSFARKVFNDFNDALEDRKPPLPPIRNPFASRRRGSKRDSLYAPEPPLRDRHLGSRADDEADRLFAALPDLNARARVMAAILSGVDRGPMFAWTWADDVDFEGNQLRAWRRKGDGSLRVYWVPMVDDLQQLLLAVLEDQRARYGKPSRWVFPNAANTGADDGAEFVRTVFHPALIAAGINTITEAIETVRVRAGKGYREVTKRRRTLQRTFRWKDLRHTFGSWLRRSGVELGTIGALLGHREDSRMTVRYAHLTKDMKHAAVARLTGLIPGFGVTRSTSATRSATVLDKLDTAESEAQTLEHVTPRGNA